MKAWKKTGKKKQQVEEAWTKSETKKLKTFKTAAPLAMMIVQ
jgi:hypothetical protein